MSRLLSQQIDNDQLLDLMQSQRYREAASLIISSYQALKKSISDGISDNITVYYHELAIDYETLKSYKKSLASYKKAADFKSKNAYNYNIARIYDAYLGDKKMAERYYRLYINNHKPEKTEKELYAYAIKRLKEL